MNTSKIVSIVITTIAVALSVSSISFTGHVFAQKDDNSNSDGREHGGSDSSSSSGSSSGSSAAALVRVITTSSRAVFPMMRQAVLRQNSK